MTRTQNPTTQTFCQHQTRVDFKWTWYCHRPSPYTFVCKRYYVDILIEELGLHLLPGNPTYNLTVLSASEVLDNHKSVLTSFGIQKNDVELDLPYIYWIRKVRKNPFKHRFIAGLSQCWTKPLSVLPTKLLTHIKQGIQKYCEHPTQEVGSIRCGS